MQSNERKDVRDLMNKLVLEIPGMLSYMAYAPTGFDAVSDDPAGNISSVLRFVSDIPADFMSKYYESWSKKERKGGKVKIRWISKVTDKNVSKYMANAIDAFPLNVNQNVFSYRKGISTGMCAQLFVGMKSILALDIKDFYYSITQSLVESLYRHYLMQSYSILNQYRRSKVELCVKYLSFLMTAPDPRPDDIRNSRENVLLQGTPHAGALSNAILYELDMILLRKCLEKNYVYARYSDNFYIGSETEIITKDFTDEVISLVENFQVYDCPVKAFSIKRNKLKLMVDNDHQRVLGIVVNDKPNISSYTESIINANISASSKRLAAEYTEALERLADPGVESLMSNRNYLRHRSQLKKDLRKLKGMISYIGAFNRAKHEKYSDYIEFVENRDLIMRKKTIDRPSIMLYIPSSEELNSCAYHPENLYLSSWKPAPHAVLVNLRESLRFREFVNCFEKGFLGITYTITENPSERFMVIPLNYEFKWLALADELMVRGMYQELSTLDRTPLRALGACTRGTYLGEMFSNMFGSMYSGDQLYNLAGSSNSIRLESIQLYNRDEPDGFVPLDRYDMGIREIMDRGRNICIVRKDLDSPDVMYNALWKLRKDILEARAFITSV